MNSFYFIHRVDRKLLSGKLLTLQNGWKSSVHFTPKICKKISQHNVVCNQDHAFVTYIKLADGQLRRAFKLLCHVILQSLNVSICVSQRLLDSR